MAAKTLMVQGTSSSVGKSLLVAALCRIFARKGVRVAPFKAQNMSNNAAVCADGAEIGRAQAVQAVAAGIEPTSDMNPILLKPEADSRSQVIVEGRPWQTLPARSYYHHQETLWPIITSALDRLRASYELIVLEGAGSPVELNLRAFDMVNMSVARHAQSPVVLVGDIDRGGIFAQLLGTLYLFSQQERGLVRGLVINKFRGDRTLFADGIGILEERGCTPVLGVIPYLPDLTLPEEDAVALHTVDKCRAGRTIDVAIVRLPHIANFDDFDPLRAERTVRVRYAQSPSVLGHPHAVILPGTKSTIADLAWLRDQGLHDAIRHLARQGCAVVGICGGYQMLGRVIRDPQRLESSVEEIASLGLLPVETVFEKAKATHQAWAKVLHGPGWLAGLAGQELLGYEIHMGQTRSSRAWLEIHRRDVRQAGLKDGAVDSTGRIWGCYLHGLFANDTFRHRWLASLGPSLAGDHAGGTCGARAALDGALDRLANAVAEALDMKYLEEIVAGE
jgi:adenosylcobyric acid synthase